MQDHRLMEKMAQFADHLVAPLKTVPRAIQLRQLGHFFRADPDDGARVAAGLGLSAAEVGREHDR
jgi:catalase